MWFILGFFIAALAVDAQAPCVDDNAGLSELMYIEYTCAQALQEYPSGICENAMFAPYCCASCSAGASVRSLAGVTVVTYQLTVKMNIILTSGDDGGSYEPFGSLSLDVGAITGNAGILVWSCERDNCHSTGIEVTKTKEIMEAEDFLDTDELNFITLHGNVKESDWPHSSDDDVGIFGGEQILAHQTVGGTTLTYNGEHDGDRVEIYIKMERINESSRSLGASESAPCHDEDGHPISGDPFEYPGDCEKFYQCSNGELTEHRCSVGLVFNPDLGVCDWPNRVDSCGNSDVELFTGAGCTGTTQTVAVSGDGANLCYVGNFNDRVASLRSSFNGVVDLRMHCSAGSELLNFLVVTPGDCIDLDPAITSVLSLINKSQPMTGYNDAVVSLTDAVCSGRSKKQCRQKRGQCKFNKNEKQCQMKACGDIMKRKACERRADCKFSKREKTCHVRRVARATSLNCDDPVAEEDQDLCDFCVEACASGNGTLMCPCHDHIVG